ncbi:hypothetical protein KCP77_01210 [Salmonella enterica subsp. enterica]|nr:hypothetical protein KCP77_01210 [Salmonella enterica subsp. enterica]
MNSDEKQRRRVRRCGYTYQPEDEGLRPHHIQSWAATRVEQTGRRCIRPISGSVRICSWSGGFCRELLLRAHELWLNSLRYPCEHYRERFTNILVDEFRVIPTIFSTPGSFCWRAIPVK